MPVYQLMVFHVKAAKSLFAAAGHAVVLWSVHIHRAKKAL